ncbi:MAG: efflux RND transporter periplasmic adaptor subunit [Desulfomonile tiedjei]|uniref:Efflux RND transporter periplasmic adaptor subunit n=1 Tax=Desulfomonile tiedjei TaxID=2358 RepID=A0A9D6Z0K3_9BACT|nr:efflux RND transporter periplasmic adaptor subunit [Desulfomonile tiedjei]
MMKSVWRLSICVVLGALYLLVQSTVSADVPENQDSAKVLTSAVDTKDSNWGSDSSRKEELGITTPEKLSAVIYPYQSCTVSTEVRGIVDFMKFKEGDPLEKDVVVSEISRARYESIVGEFRGNYEAVVRTLERAKENLAVQEELYDKRACTFDDILKARSEVRILEARKNEAEFKLKQAQLNLDACIIRAPFSGNVSVLYHEPYEAVENLEKLFGVVDTSKVYARVNWPESRLSELEMGKKAYFQYGGRTYEGAIEKISSLIDPASKSKRVHILIDNPNGKLQVGMSGSVSLSDKAKVSMDIGTPSN